MNHMVIKEEEERKKKERAQEELRKAIHEDVFWEKNKIQEQSPKREANKKFRDILMGRYEAAAEPPTDEGHEARFRKQSENEESEAEEEEASAEKLESKGKKSEASAEEDEEKIKEKEVETEEKEEEIEERKEKTKEKEEKTEEKKEEDEEGGEKAEKGKARRAWDWTKENYDWDKEKREARDIYDASKNAAKGAAAIPIATGRAASAAGSAGYGMAAVAAGTLKPQGATIFFFIAILFHLLDLAVDQFGKSNSGITGFRFGLYSILALYAWFAFYGGTTAGLDSFKKPAAVSGLCFIIPLILSLILKISMPAAMQSTITAIFIFFPIWPIVVAFGIAPDEPKIWFFGRHSFFGIIRFIFVAVWVVAALPTIYTAITTDLNVGASKINVLNSIRFFVRLIWTNLVIIWTGVKSSFILLGGGIQNIPKIFAGGIQSQIQYATGDYYTGMVDENQKEPIGVYLENMQVASNKFFEGDTVTIWGVIRAKTMDPEKTITIKTICYAEMPKPDISPDVSISKVSITNPIGLEDVDFTRMEVVQGDADPTGPDNSFNMVVSVMDEKDLNCEFVPNALGEGSWTAYLSSTFNFDTYSYLKAYFMDQERLRAIRRQNKDPLDDYGIADKNPVAVYTQGPIMIGMQVTQPLIGLDRQNKNELRLGITLENQWKGRLKRINDLVIKVPPSMSIAFCDYNIKADACKADECEDGKYAIVYKLQDNAEGGKRGKESLKNMENDFQTINCKVNVENVDSALGDSPIATHYFKVSADYIYELKAAIQITIEKSTLSSQ